MNTRINAVIRELENRGHSVRVFNCDGQLCYEIDDWMPVTAQQIEELADRLYALLELNGLFAPPRNQKQNN
jgi:hypothetical protein